MVWMPAAMHVAHHQIPRYCGRWLFLQAFKVLSIGVWMVVWIGNYARLKVMG